MARRVLAVTGLAVLLITGTALAASKSVPNRSISVASSVTITFSQDVRIVGWSTHVFALRLPTATHAPSYSFYGGELPRGGSFHVSWTPSDAQITSVTWTPAIDVPWDEIPVTIAYPREPVIVCLEARGDPVESPTTWGLPGHEVQEIKVQLAEDSVAVSVELYSGDSFGNYAYVIRLWRDRQNIYFRFVPPLWKVEVFFQDWPSWVDLDPTHLMYISGLSVRALVPYSTFSGVVDTETLSEWSADFHIWIIDGPPKGEDFYFPGDGIPARTPASYLASS